MALPVYRTAAAPRGSFGSGAGAHPGTYRRSAVAAATDKSSSRFYLGLVGMAMATGTVVLIEPAPIDLALMALLGWGLIARHLVFRRVLGTPIFLLGVIAVANLVSIVNATDVPRAIWYCMVTMYVMISCMFFAGLISKYGNQAMNCLLNGYVIAGLISAVCGILAYFQLIPFQKVLLLQGRPKGFFKDPNVYGPYLVPVALYSLARLQNERGPKSDYLLWLAICLTSLIGLFLSFSRACWINAVAALAIYFTLTRLFHRRSEKSRHRLLRSAFGLALAVGGLALALTNSEVSRMIAERVGSNGLHNYDEDRFSTHEKALGSAVQQPLGIGPGQAEVVFDYAAHSTYLRLLAENGLLGLLAFIALTCLTLIRSIHLVKVSRNEQWRTLLIVSAACLAGYVVNSLVIDTVHWRHIWLFFAIPWANHPDMNRIEAVQI